MGIKLKDRSGQMTVEFVVAFPVMLVVGVIAVNALLFFSECAAFDRVACEAVRIHATSPAYGHTVEQSCGAIEQELSTQFDKEYESPQITYSQEGTGHLIFTATLRFSPTLFGMGLRSEIFGVALPQLEHSTIFVVDTYKPGVLL